MSCEGCAYKNSDHPTFWSQRSATLYNGRAPQTMTSRSCKHPSTCTPPLHVLQRTTYSTLLDLCRNTYSSPMNPKIRNYCLALKSLLLSLSLKRFFPDRDSLHLKSALTLSWPKADTSRKQARATANRPTRIKLWRNARDASRSFHIHLISAPVLGRRLLVLGWVDSYVRVTVTALATTSLLQLTSSLPIHTQSTWKMSTDQYATCAGIRKGNRVPLRRNSVYI